VKEDGTLDFSKGFQGRVDPKGWRMILGENEEPKFINEELFKPYPE
jgi:hypothetical protein